MSNSSISGATQNKYLNPRCNFCMCTLLTAFSKVIDDLYVRVWIQRPFLKCHHLQTLCGISYHQLPILSWNSCSLSVPCFYFLASCIPAPIILLIPEFLFKAMCSPINICLPQWVHQPCIDASKCTFLIQTSHLLSGLTISDT